MNSTITDERELKPGFYWCRYYEVKTYDWEIYWRDKDGRWEQAFRSKAADWTAYSDQEFERQGHEIGPYIEEPAP